MGRPPKIKAFQGKGDLAQWQNSLSDPEQFDSMLRNHLPEELLESVIVLTEGLISSAAEDIPNNEQSAATFEKFDKWIGEFKSLGPFDRELLVVYYVQDLLKEAEKARAHKESKKAKSREEAEIYKLALANLSTFCDVLLFFRKNKTIKKVAEMKKRQPAQRADPLDLQAARGLLQVYDGAGKNIAESDRGEFFAVMDIVNAEIDKQYLRPVVSRDEELWSIVEEKLQNGPWETTRSLNVNEATRLIAKKGSNTKSKVGAGSLRNAHEKISKKFQDDPAYKALLLWRLYRINKNKTDQ